MRLLAALSLLGLFGVGVGVSGTACVPKTASPNHATGQCISVQSDPTDIIDKNGAVTIPIQQFDQSAHPNAVLDAIYINYFVGDYLPDVTYSVQSSGQVTVAVSVDNTWNLISNADGYVVSLSDLQGNTALNGLGSVNPLSGTTGLKGCFNATVGTNGVYVKCKVMQIENKAFQIKDNTYAVSPVPNAILNTPITMNPDLSAANTYTDFIGYSGTASNGLQIATTDNGPIDTNYIGTGFWGFITAATDAISGVSSPSQVGGQVTTTGTGIGLTVTATHHLYLTIEVQYDYHVPTGGNGDPQFIGFQGQSFQVHGAPDSYFALISAPTFYVNSRFDYISTGSCTYNETACFTHPGTYMGMIYVGMRDSNILITAGPHATGFASVLVNDKPMVTGDRFVLSSVSADSYIQVLSKSKLVLTLDSIIITIHNSDLFINFDLALTDKELLSSGATKHVIPSGSSSSQVQHQLSSWYGQYNPLHGLIGQTWRNVKYQDGKMFQGDITEYQLDKIIDHTFLYCVYQQ